MKKLIIGGCLIIGSCCSAAAEEVQFSGWFAGVDAGYILRTQTSTVNGNQDYDGFTAGVIAGHWWQMDALTLGFDIGATLGGAQYETEEVFSPTFSTSWNVSEFATVSVRAKAGRQIGRALIYGAAGFQFVRSSVSFESIVSGVSDRSTDSADQSGFTVALGADYMLNDNFSLKAEVGLNSYWADEQNDYGGGNIKAGLNYHFD